ncbi:MAG: cation diffusion facilitator family transporter [Spirosomataceae bacterium]
MANSHKNLNLRAILFSFIASIILTALKFIAYFQTQSYAVLTDATESIVNVVASGFALYSIYLTRQPKDENHPYGHGKIEFFSAGFEGALIMIAGIFTLFPAVISFFKPHPIANITEGILFISVTIVINGGLGYYLQWLGKKNNSLALVADGKHLMSDSISSLILIFGLLVVKYISIKNIDTYLSILLSFYLIKNGYQLLRKSIGGLMDESDYQTLEQLTKVLNVNRHQNWIDVHNFRVQRYGSDLHIDAHLTLPYYISLQESHDEVVAFEEVFRSNIDGEIEIFTHTDPCVPKCCSYCLISNCPVRKFQFENKIEWEPSKLGINAKHFASN